MKQKTQKQAEGFDVVDLQVTLPVRDYTKMSPRQVFREGCRMYSGLQAVWHAELTLPCPDWKILETVSRQMKIFEERCPEVCQ